jgi:hypothetical protein
MEDVNRADSLLPDRAGKPEVSSQRLGHPAEVFLGHERRVVDTCLCLELERASHKVLNERVHTSPCMQRSSTQRSGSTRPAGNPSTPEKNRKSREIVRGIRIAAASTSSIWKGADMLDRQKVEAILARRFPGATRPEIATAANAIMGLDDEWEELADRQFDDVLEHVKQGVDLRFFRRRTSL